MRSRLTLFAAVCVASLAMSTSASAATILSFSQQASVDQVVLTPGNPTTLASAGVVSGASIPITISQIGNSSNLSGPQSAAFGTFLNTGGGTAGLTSAASAVTSGVQNGFNGQIIISSLPQSAGFGTVILTVTITNGRVIANGASGGFEASSGTTNGGNPTIVTLQSNNINLTPIIGTGPVPGAASLAFVNITPSQSGGASFTSFTAQNAGNFSTVSAIPEPASVISAGTALLAGLGCFGWSRRKSSKA